LWIQGRAVFLNPETILGSALRRGGAVVRAVGALFARAWALAVRWKWVTAPACAVALFGAGIVTGNWASDAEIATQVRAAVSEWRVRESIDETEVRWQPLPADTSLHDFEFAIFRLAPFETYGRGGALEEIEGNIVFASPLGEIAYLSEDLVLTPLDVRAPMNLDALLADPINDNPAFEITHFRVLDLLAVETGPDTHDLYVSHHRFNNGCFEVVVSRTQLRQEAGELKAASGEWEEIFVAEPCVAPMDYYVAWVGEQSGGRMVLRDERTLLLSLGDQFLDGIHSETSVSQDLEADLGKIIAIDLRTEQSRVFASGLRNPQGLMIARDGTIWETEHGPEGGDEVNIIREGLNYGWPLVTYGADYGGRRRVDWPLNPAQGRHDGYEKPRFSFVPSVGVSNLVQLDPREFPLWADHLLVASMNGNSLFLLRVEEGGRVVYSEPAPMAGRRIRDMIVLEDGRCALLTDGGNLILLRNQQDLASQVSNRDDTMVVTVAPGVELTARQEGNLWASERGRLLFNQKCSTCHTLNDAIAIGPPLDSILGKEIGSHPGFDYSPALANHGGEWDDRRLTAFLYNPEDDFAGTSMPQVPLERDEAYAITAYLSGH
jgi:cytochrome c2